MSKNNKANQEEVKEAVIAQSEAEEVTETPEEVAEAAEEVVEEPKAEPKAPAKKEKKIYFVNGYGNVIAYSQKEAEEKAAQVMKKIRSK